jgi:TRAP-type C4-dicarboxylate transport system substrate-binding protein
MKLVGALALLVGVGVSQNASATEVIKIGTLAPKASPWGQVFTVWEKAVKEKSNGAVELQFFYNGQQGDEGAMVGKMKAGQLDGAAVTAVGLGKVYKPISALQMPGLFLTWAKLDGARDAMKGEFEKGLNDAGFSLAGWGDVGAVHLMSKGFEIHSPDDIKGKKPYMWRDDVVQPILYQVVGGVTPVPLNVPEVLPNLNTGAINIVNAPSLAAEQLQWSSKLDTINEDVSAMAIGALIFSSKRIDALPADLKAIVMDTGKIAANALTKRIRSEDDAAFARMKGKMKVVTLSADEKSKWAGIFKATRQRLAQGTFDPALVAKLEGLAQ